MTISEDSKELRAQLPDEYWKKEQELIDLMRATNDEYMKTFEMKIDKLKQRFTI
jgi:hypothetical protein